MSHHLASVSLRVSLTPSAKRQADALRGKAAKAYEGALIRLEAEGCAAADYRLSGEVVDRICSLALYGRYRALVCFPEEERVVVVAVAEHLRGDPEDVYGSLYELLEIPEPTAKRTKPPCCDEGGKAPVNPELLGRFQTGAKALIRSAELRR
jgi:hypothetical protein